MAKTAVDGIEFVWRLKTENKASRLRAALLCALLLHGFAAWAWKGELFQPAPAPSPIAVMLQLESTKAAMPKAPAAKVLPQPNNQSKPQRAPKLMTQPANAESETQAKAVPKVIPKPATEPLINAPIMVAQESNSIAASPSAERHKSKESAEGQAEAAYTPPQYRAAHLKNPKIETPFISRERNESGIVRLWVKVSAKGEPMQVKIEKSSGFSRLDDVAYKAVKETWRFVPAKRGDTPIESEVAFNIPFVLKDAE